MNATEVTAVVKEEPVDPADDLPAIEVQKEASREADCPSDINTEEDILGQEDALTSESLHENFSMYSVSYL